MRYQLLRVEGAFAGMQIPIVLREAAAGDFNPDPMARGKLRGDAAQIDIEFVHAPRHQQFRARFRIPEAAAHNSLREAQRNHN